MTSQAELKSQLRELMKLDENMTCVDCDDKRPTWASLIVPPPGAAFSDPIGCFCCYHCSGAHRRMGTHICFVRSTDLDEWKEKELEAMKKGGNNLINRLFEGNLTQNQKKAVKPDKHTELDARSNFIYDKYQHRNWYDTVKAGQESTFQPPPSKVSRSSGVEFDDFFASRAHSANDWHDSNDGSKDLSFDPRDIVTKSPGKGKGFGSRHSSSGSLHSTDFSPTPHMDHSISAKSLFQAEATDKVKPIALAMSTRDVAFTRTPRNGLDGRANLMSTLQRMDSKREMLDTIRAFDLVKDDELLSPKKVAQTNRRKKIRERQSESLHSESKTREREYRSALRGSTGPSEERSLKKKQSSSANDSGDEIEKPRGGRRVRRSKSDDTENFDEHTTLNDRPRREPKRGIGRAKSMDEDLTKMASKQRSRSRSVKRTIRRNASTSESSQDGSGKGPRLPPRRPRGGGGDDDKTVSSKRSTAGESVVSRRSRDDDSKVSRGRHRDMSKPRTPSPTASEATGRSSSRRRQASIPRKPEGNAIAVRRVPIVRDPNERSPGAGGRAIPSGKSPRSRKRVTDSKGKANLTELLTDQ
eukprot:Nitzschia sp. Nitz4//scaffold76_size158648//117363//119200//NITZ4_002562-RA/size158648-processed-gene-0.248-mRNA-1//1//CDS//3329557893//7023//frame0